MPTPEQARQVVDKMDRLPAGGGGVSGERRAPYADFSALTYPVYLPILAPRAFAGSETALEALADMPTPEATKVLIGLLEHPTGAFAQQARRALNMRLPDPQLEGKIAGRNMFDNDWKAPRRWLVSQAWRADFAPAVRQVGRKLLARPDVDSLREGAFILECLGEQEDLPALVRGLDRAVRQARDLPREEHVYPRPAALARNSCGQQT
jgi:hypothetical protein